MINNVVYNAVGSTRRAYSPSSMGYRGNGSFMGPAFAAIIILALIAVMFMSMRMPMPGGITKSTVDREPLDKQYVTLGNQGWYEDHLNWIRSPAKLEKGLKHFFDKTGVCPYLVITEDVHGSYHPTGEECWEYAREIYQEKFNDEGHLVFVFQSINESDEFMMACYTGAQAKVVIDDDEALEILYDYFDANWWTDKDEETFFSDSFADAADRIMKKTPNYMFILCMAGIGLCVVFIIFCIVKNINKRKKEEAEETERILNTPIDQL